MLNLVLLPPFWQTLVSGSTVNSLRVCQNKRNKKMGLDIKVYKNISITTDYENSDFYCNVIDDEWLYKIKNLQSKKYYKGDVVFRGISYPYSQHSRFRETLIKLIDREDLLDSEGKIIWDKLSNDVPFEAFINFADNDGCLDFEVSNTIYLDFEKYSNKANRQLGQWNLEYYSTWLETFKIAKDNGVVVYS
jgi:hypothetical protein